MATVFLALHIMVAAALVGVVLLQKAEAGGLVSGGGGGGGFLTGRGTANLLTRTTAVLAAMFFATSIILSILARQGTSGSVFDATKATPPAASGSATPGTPADASAPAAPALPGGRGGVLEQLQKGGNERLPQLPNTR